MTGDSPEIKRLLSALSLKIKHNNQTLIRDIQACHAGNESFASALPPSAMNSSSTQSMTPVQIVLSLNGLQRMDSEFVEVRDLLTSILPFLWSSPAVFDSSEFVSMMNGLKSMKSEHAEARSYLSYLSFGLKTSTGDYSDGKIVLQIMHNLNGMDSSHAEVRHFLDVLTQSIQNSSAAVPRPTGSNKTKTTRFAGTVLVLRGSPLLDQSCPQVVKLMDILRL
jgi:hypothetical protein